MHMFGGWSGAVHAREWLVVQKRIQQAEQMRIFDPCNDSAQLGEHLQRIALGGRKKIGEIHLRIENPRHLVDGELRPVLENLEAVPLTLMKSSRSKVSITSATLSHILASISPVRSPSSRDRVRVARFLLPDIFDVNQEDRREHLVGLQVADVRRFHLFLRGAGGRRSRCREPEPSTAAACVSPCWQPLSWSRFRALTARIGPGGIFARRRSGVDPIRLDLQKRLLAKLGEIFAQRAFHARLEQLSSDSRFPLPPVRLGRLSGVLPLAGSGTRWAS